VAIIHKGRILAEGSVGELQGRYLQPDMEELFFDLISRSEHEPAVPAC
jgi:ABC-type Na+ transport system ATPase subunit NatA